MSGMLYKVDFSGRIIPGWELDEVKANLAELLKADEETIYKLFSGKRTVIKKNVDHQTALKINNIFKDAGADCMITPIDDGSATPPPPLPGQPLQMDHTAPMDQAAPVPAAQNATAIESSTAAVAKASPTITGTGPSALWYVFAALLFLIPVITGATTLFSTLNAYLDSETRLAVPGETDLQIDNPGTYVFYYETSRYRVYNAANYQLGRDFAITIMDLSTGRQMALQPVEMPYTEEDGSVTLHSIAQIQFDTLGAYSATVVGEIPGSDGLLVRRFEIWEMAKGIILGGVLLCIGVVIAPIIALVVFVRRQKQNSDPIKNTLTEEQENNWAMWAHVSTFLSMLVPLGNLIGPIVVWQLKKNESEFVTDQAKEALNFQISMMIYMMISVVLILVVIGIFLLIGLVLFSLIMVIVAGVKANDGEYYRYPMCLRLIPQKAHPSR
ncbi:MAG: DUF4870 domain-containing protein [Desulfobacterales bacterium]|nr:DUF4870 domain-containing protein [Desulfobacterales bacterium]